jgi:hypothetical protein
MFVFAYAYLSLAIFGLVAQMSMLMVANCHDRYIIFAMDPYEKMISNPEFGRDNTLVNILYRHVQDSASGEGIYERQNGPYIVEGLAVAYAGLRQVYIDIPSDGRVTTRNPAPAINYMLASPTGYREKPMPLS